MRRARWFRPLAAALALWLPLVFGEPAALHVCPEHASAHPMSAGHAGGHHRQSARGGSFGAESAGAHMAASRRDQSSHSAPAPGHHHDCACISCCVSAGAFVASSAPALPLANAVLPPGAPVLGHRSFARPDPEHSRPYTTGPPATSLVHAARLGTIIDRAIAIG